MRQVWLRRSGGPEVLKVEEHSDPSAPGPDEAIVDIHYSGINFADVVMRQGLYREAPPKPFVPGYEGSGIIAAVGSNIKNFKVGDPVVVGSLFGGYSSKLKVPGDLLFKKPSYLTLEESAGLAVNWITAHAAIVDMGRIRAGDRVVIDSATGGVGTIALQMLKCLGAETIGLTSSPSKMDYIKSLGATPMLQDDFNSKTDLKGFDFILNSQGGKTIRQHYDRLGMTGRIVSIGMSAGIGPGGRDLFQFIGAALQMPKFSIIKMFNLNTGVYALNALTLLDDAKYRANLAKSWAEVEHYKLKPHIDSVFPAEKASEAHAHLQSRKAKGKVLISWK
ncbi:MAG: zinc-binding dehydrogenase [Bdellovibrionales bacterium]|nr:zinc-binding dehydrogenase [Bdellovibrionales bacterium]